MGRTGRAIVAVLAGIAAGCAAAPVPPRPAPPPLLVRAVQVEGIEPAADLHVALAAFAGRPLDATLMAEAGAVVRDYLDWLEWRDVRVEPAPAPDGVLHLAVVARPPGPAEEAPPEYFEIAMPAPDPVPPPDGPAGARAEPALDASFGPWLASPARVLIDATDRRMYVKRDDGVVSYAVAVGTARTPTPAGDYWVEAMTHKPTWYPPPSIRRERAARGQPLPAFVPPGRGNPLGDWFVRLQNSIGIHGTNQPRSIGTAASHGCVRMHDRDVAELVALLRPGDRIRIVRARAQDLARAAGGANAGALRP